MNIDNLNISCDVCLDLIPLVQDKVASEDSTKLVFEHIKTCESCRVELENTSFSEGNIINDKKVMAAIRKSMISTGFIITILGTIVGVYLSNSMGMFYNFLIMPIVGICGYILLKNRWYYIPLGVFLLSYAWIFLQNIFDGSLSLGFRLEIVWIPIFLSGIYAGLTLLGTTIAALIKFTFREEVKNEKK